MFKTLINRLFGRKSAATTQLSEPRDEGEIAHEFSWWKREPAASDATFDFVNEDTWVGDTHVYATDLKAFTLEIDTEDDSCQ